MGDFGVSKMFGSLTQGEEKIATDTSLIVDDILKNIGIYGPAVILALSFLYTPELSKSAGVQCYHPEAQGFTERLYMNNYCWEKLQDYNPKEGRESFDFEATLENDGRNRVDWTQSATEGGSLAYHRSFVLAMLVAIFICILPSSVWAVIDFDKQIKVQGDYLEVGVEEAFQLVIRQMVSLVKSELATTDVIEATQGPVKTRLKNHLLALHESGNSPFTNSDKKFGGFASLIKLKLQEQKLVLQYINKRFATIILIILTSSWLWWLYVDDTTGEFDCLIPMSPLDSNGNTRENGVQYIVKCGLDGVAIRIFLVKILVLANILAIGAVAYQWVAERADCQKTRDDFRTITELAFPDHVVKNLKQTVHNTSDFDLLLFLTMRNLERENNKLYSTCSFALRSARASTGGSGLNKDENISTEFFEHLYGIVARGMSDDEEVEATVQRIGSD